MTEPFLGQIIQGGWNFAPQNYHYCDGSLMSIPQNTALFSLLGTSFGGDGQNTFALPDLRGRAMLGTGTAAGGGTYAIGQSGGTNSVTLTSNAMPQHTHAATFTPTASLSAATAPASQPGPGAAGAVLARAIDASGTVVPNIYCPAGTATPIALGGLNVAGTVTNAPAGGSQPFSVQNPFLAISVVIALTGIYPSRN